MNVDRSLVPCRNFQALEPGIRALVRMHPDINEDSWWMRIGLREVVPYATVENGKRVGFCLLATGQENGPLMLVAGIWASTYPLSNRPNLAMNCVSVFWGILNEYTNTVQTQISNTQTHFSHKHTNAMHNTQTLNQVKPLNLDS